MAAPCVSRSRMVVGKPGLESPSILAYASTSDAVWDELRQERAAQANTASEAGRSGGSAHDGGHVQRNRNPCSNRHSWTSTGRIEAKTEEGGVDLADRLC